RGLDRLDPAALVDHRQLEPEPLGGAGFADPVEEAEVLGEAAERDVLAVVGRRLWVAVAVRESLDGAAEGRSRLEHGDLVPSVHELERGGEAGEPASDDGCFHRASAPTTTRSFVTGDSDGGPPKTSKPFFSIRSRVER